MNPINRLADWIAYRLTRWYVHQLYHDQLAQRQFWRLWEQYERIHEAEMKT